MVCKADIEQKEEKHIPALRKLPKGEEGYCIGVRVPTCSDMPRGNHHNKCKTRNHNDIKQRKGKKAT
eukprot:12613255-Heterocapsa_arctica.AAC.1